MNMKYKIITAAFILSLVSAIFLVKQSAANTGYEVIATPQKTANSEKIEVVEVFWYGCPHCYALEPELEKWLQDLPEDVEFRRMPGILGKNWIPHAKAFYVAEKLGILEQIHRPLFNAIHNKKRDLMSPGSLRDFFAEYGVEKDTFEKLYNSEAVDKDMKAAFVAGKGYGITGVPALIVNGKYRTSPSLAGSYDSVMRVVDQLIEEERSN